MFIPSIFLKNNQGDGSFGWSGQGKPVWWTPIAFSKTPERLWTGPWSDKNRFMESKISEDQSKFKDTNFHLYINAGGGKGGYSLSKENPEVVTGSMGDFRIFLTIKSSRSRILLQSLSNVFICFQTWVHFLPVNRQV